MLTIHLKILLRYRQILVALFPAIAGVFFVKYLLPRLTLGGTAIPFLFFLFCIMGDAFSAVFDPSFDELRKYHLFPIRYESVIINKNLSLFFVSAFNSAVLSLTVLYVFRLSFHVLLLSLAYILTIIFLYAAAGNLLSSTFPRINSQDLALLRLIVSTFMLLLVSIPYIIIKSLGANVFYYAAYIIFTALGWRYLSIPLAAKQFSRNAFKMIDSL